MKLPCDALAGGKAREIATKQILLRRSRDPYESPNVLRHLVGGLGLWGVAFCALLWVQWQSSVWDARQSSGAGRSGEWCDLLRL